MTTSSYTVHIYCDVVVLLYYILVAPLVAGDQSHKAM